MLETPEKMTLPDLMNVGFLVKINRVVTENVRAARREFTPRLGRTRPSGAAVVEAVVRRLR